MHRRTLTLIVLALGIPLAMAACGQSSQPASSSSPWRKQTVHVSFGKPMTEKRFKVGDKKVNFGDRLVSQFGLHQGSKTVGSVIFHCASRDENSANCAASFSLPGGQIASVTTQSLAGTFPVTGGSGKYMGATGQWRATAEGKVTLDLLLPVTS